MPVTMDDTLTDLVLRALTRLPPVSGQLILSSLQVQGENITDLRKAVADVRAAVVFLIQKVDSMSQTNQTTDQQFKAEMDATLEAVRRSATVTDGVLKAFNDVKDKLAAAIADATSKGATAEELASLQALHASIDSNTDKLASATVENTAAADEQPAPQPQPQPQPAPADGTADGGATT